MQLLICGIPASGKSEFARWLVKEHGYVRCPAGEEPGANFLEEIAQARRIDQNVVVDWGFPPQLIGQVRELIADGLSPWWFDGDRDAAFQSFVSRPDHPAAREDWDRQLSLINDGWPEIEAAFAGRILEVVHSGPTYMAPSELFELIQPA